MPITPVSSRLLHLGVLALAGCALPPAAESLGQTAAGWVPAVPLPPKSSLSARVGVEFVAVAAVGRSPRAGPRRGPELEPASILTSAATRSTGRGAPSRPPAPSRVTIEPAERSALPSPLPEPMPLERAPTPWLDEEELDRIEDPLESLALRFLNNAMGHDRRRIQRKVGLSALFESWRDAPGQAPATLLDQRVREDRALLLSRERSALLSKPLRHALRDLLMVDLDEVVEDLKSTIPFAGGRRSNAGPGRISLRLRPWRTEDPGRIGYVWHGWRIATSRDELRAGFERQLTDQLYMSIQSDYGYRSNELGLWGNLHYRLHRNTRLSVAVSDRMDITTGAALYHVVHSPVVIESVDESPGVLFYVEHLF